MLQLMNARMSHKIHQSTFLPKILLTRKYISFVKAIPSYYSLIHINTYHILWSWKLLHKAELFFGAFHPQISRVKHVSALF